MAKAIKTAVKAFVVTFLVVTGVAFIGGVLGISALSGLVALDIAVLTATGSLLNGLFSKGVNAVSENFGTKVATRTATAPRQIIYGKARVGGTITHIETSGTDNYKLSMIVVLAGHEVESLEEVLINDTKLTTTSSGGFQYATNSRFINTDNENNFGSGRLLRYKFKDGSQTTADSTITGATSLGSNDKFIGMAYMLIEMVFDSEAFGGGIPPLAFVIKGKKVYDPRTSTTAWSDNPALCVRDYITDTTYGLKATSDEVLDTTALGGFASAANTCDSAAGAITTATVNGAVSNLSVVQIDASPTNSLIDVGQIVTGTGISGTVRVIYRFGNLVYLNTTVTVADGVTLTFNEELYKANGITNMAADGSGVLEGLLSSCAGKISYINGKFVMFAGASVTPDMTITDDNLLAPISVQTKNSGGETFNTVKAVYVDGNNNYVATDSPTETTVNPATSNTFLSEDTPSGESQANYRKTLEIQLPFTDTTTMAQRLQRTALLHSRQEVSLSVLCNIAFMQLQPFDWVYLTNSRLGYTNKTFEVLSTNLEVIESDDVPILATRLVLKEIDSSVYAFASSSYTNPIDEGSSVSTGSFSVTAPTGLSLSVDLQLDSATSKVNIDASWTNNPDDLIQGTEILYGTASDTYIGSILVGKGKTKAVIPNLLSNSTYYVVARHFSSNNVFSDNTAEQSVGTGLPAAPSAPTNLTATTGKALVIGLEWDAPSNSDLRAVKVYRHTSSFTPTDDTYLVSTITSEPSETQKITFGLEDGLTAGTTYHFAVRAINFSGTHSSFTSTTTGSFTLVDAGDIDLPEFSGYFHKEGTTTTALTASQFNTEYGRQPLVDDILIMVNTSASPKVSKAYKWSGSTFVEITNFTTGDLVVDGTLAGDKIIAQSISADRVDTDFISTLNLLTTSATVTNNITIGTGDNVFKAETGVGIHLGDAVFADAPFSVTEAGVLKAESGTIGGINLASNKLYVGTGTVNNSNTAFYVDDSGNFSLKDKVYWNGTSLSVDGNITATTLDVVEANIQNLTLTLGGGILQDGSGNNLTVTNVINPDFPVDGLLHYFPLNGFSDPNDTTPADVVDVVSNVTGVITGSNGSFSTDSPNGQSYVNGATTGITLLSDAQADTWQSTTGDYTVALWFKSTSESGEALARIITRDASDFWSLVIDQDETGNQTIGLYTDGDLLTWNGASVNEWHHIALVVNGTTSAKVYVDGILRITDTNIAYTTASRPIVLGCNTESTINTAIHVFLGKLSDVRFYTKAITDKQVQSLYMNPAGGLPAKIEGDLFVTNSITSDKLIVNTLSSLSANLGSITAGDIDIGSGAFSVTSAGVLDASGATISGSFSSGTGNSIFKADTNGIYLGNATFGSAPFRVSTGGALTATSGTIGGVTLATNKIHLGTGTFNNSNTAFYVDTAGQFSLKDKLSFNGADLIINGKINPPILSSSGQAGLYSLIPTSITGGSDDPQPVISADTDTDLGTVILATGDPYDSSLWTSGSPDTNATGLWLGGSGTIYMLGTGQSFRNSPISSGINSLGTNANGWKALFLHSHSSYSDTTNALYSIGGSLYFNGSQLGTGSGDITGVTITTSGGSLTGGASYSSGNATFTLDIGSTITGAKTFDNNVVIQGNLDVQGTTTTIDTTNLDVQDKNITLNYGTGDTSANANGAGITIQDAVSAGNDATLTWNTSTDRFELSHGLDLPDSAILRFGDGADLRIQHNGTNSFIDNENGGLLIRNKSNDRDVDIQSDDGAGGLTNYFRADGSTGSAILYNYGDTKLATSSSGIDVTGNISVTGTVDGRDIATDGTKLDGIEAGATTDQTQAEINALGITAIGLSGSPNITVGTINSGAITSTGNSQFDGEVQVGDTVSQNSYGLLQVNQEANNDESGIGILSSGHARSMRIWVDESNSYINSGNGGAANLIFNEAITVSSGGNLTGVGTISSGDITASGSSGAVITAEHNGGGLANDAFIGGFIFKNNDTSGTEPHYAGITARAVSTFGAMALEFFADRDDYENDTPALTLSSVGTSGTTNNLSFQNITAITGVTTISSGAITSSGNITTSTGTITAHTITATNTLTLPTAIDLSSGNNRITFNGNTSTGLFFDEGEPEFVLKGSTATPTYVEGLGIRNGSTNTDIIDQSRNLTNIGTISSGQVNATTTADATPAIIATNTGGLSSTIARFVGDSDSLEIRNEASTGDYRISNTQQENGIVLYDGTAGVEILYNGSVRQSWSSLGGTVITGGVDATGQITTDSHVQSGDGSGGVALTINDGYGNANITWNHLSGVPEQNGNAARIEVNTDSTSNATMFFELASNVTSGVAVQTANIMQLNINGLYMDAGKYIHGSDGVTINVDDADFIVEDNTDSVTNFIWRDFSASKLYLGTSTAQVELRSSLNLQSGHNISINGAEVISSSGVYGGTLTSSQVTTALGYTPYQENTALSATTGVFSSNVNIDRTLYLDARYDGGSGDDVLAFKDSGGNYSIRQNVNDGNGNYSISIGYSGAGSGQYAVTGDGVSKILFSGHGQDGGVSLNAAPTGTAGNNISFSIGLLVEGSDNTIRVGASANGTGLDSAEGTKVFDASGNAFATSYSVGSQTVINSSGQIIGDIITQNIDMSTGNNRITFDGNTSTGLFYDEGEPEFVLKGSTATPLYVEGLGIRSGTTNTDIIDASRNLSNIGTISSGAITSTGINNSSAELIDLDNSTYLILKDPQGSAGIYIGGTGDTNNYYDNNSHFFRSKTGGTLRTLINADGVDAKFGGFRINGTTVIDSSRNLTNITAETITGSLNEALNFSASTTNDARGISFNARTALTADSSDGWLRLNQNSEFSNGVYTPANFRSDGNVRGASYSVVGTVVIDSSRNLTNIGTATTSGKLNVGNAAINGRNMIEIQTSANTLDRGISFQNSGAAYSNSIFAEDVGGNDARLVFTGGNASSTITALTRDFMINNQSGGGGVSGDIHARGDVVAFSSTVSSDERLKYDIEYIKNPLEIIQSLKGRHFKWKKNQQQSSGVIAQEVEQSEMSFLVSDKVDIENPDETIKRVKYDGFIGVLIEAIKEQQQQIEELKSKLEDIV